MAPFYLFVSTDRSVLNIVPFLSFVKRVFRFLDCELFLVCFVSSDDAPFAAAAVGLQCPVGDLLITCVCPAYRKAGSQRFDSSLFCHKESMQVVLHLIADQALDVSRTHPQTRVWRLECQLSKMDGLCCCLFCPRPNRLCEGYVSSMRGTMLCPDAMPGTIVFPAASGQLTSPVEMAVWCRCRHTCLLHMSRPARLCLRRP
jgi:hypothetical protein